MATSLYLITNSKLLGNETEKEWKEIVKKLRDLKMDTTSFINADNEIIKETGDWDYEVEEDPEYPFNVDFSGPFHIQPCLYKNIGVIYTIYKYRLLYEMPEVYFLNSFRKDLFNILKIIEGTEVIYLADNACNKLSTYLELMAWENIPYEDIKEKMIKEFGKPITDYAHLNFNKLSYSKINEFFLDDFNNTL